MNHFTSEPDAFFSGLVSLFVGTWVPMQFNLIQHNHDIVLSNLQFIIGKILKSILPAALVPEMGTDVGSKSADVKWGTSSRGSSLVFLWYVFVFKLIKS